MDYVPGVDGKDDGQPRVLASFMTALMKGEPLVLVDGGEVYRTFCFVDDAVESVVRMIDRPEKSIGHAFNVGNPHNNIQIKELAALMIELYSGLTGKPLGTTRDVAGVDYYGKGYPPLSHSTSPHLPTSPHISPSLAFDLSPSPHISPHLPFEDFRPSSSLALHASAHHGAMLSLIRYEDSDLRIPSMRLVKSQLDWEPATSLRQAMEATMKVFIEKYADKLESKRAAQEADMPAAKALKL